MISNINLIYHIDFDKTIWNNIYLKKQNVERRYYIFYRKNYFIEGYMTIGHILIKKFLIPFDDKTSRIIRFLLYNVTWYIVIQTLIHIFTNIIIFKLYSEIIILKHMNYNFNSILKE